ncbi:hypothetical protein POM88_013819 [Heracleum sosnowskyi]|uniref:Uncharacterized protein n=1 Tax=Heracleum sosnowskyi TaxID=360622 RepID=A0AAD8J0L1_9APIA|nr:hypothetical protein POM88_013819 [Heracleum sosnowskyi]
MVTDKFAAPASVAAKEIGTNLFRSFILPKDHAVYDREKATSAYSELLGHTTMAVPWAAVFEQKVKDLDIQLRGLKLVEERADAAENQVEALGKEVSSLNKRITMLKSGRDAVRMDLNLAFARLGRKTDKLKASHKAEKKARKLVILSEDRSFFASFDEAVCRAHAAGFEYKQLLDEGMEDPITRPEEHDVPPEVSSGSESELSN